MNSLFYSRGAARISMALRLSLAAFSVALSKSSPNACQDCLLKYCQGAYGQGQQACSACIAQHHDQLVHSDCGHDCPDKGLTWCQSARVPTPPPPAPPTPPPPTPSPYQHQQWVPPSSSTRNTWLFASNEKKCVDLAGGDTTNGNSIVIWDCNNGQSQQWSYDPFKSGFIYYSADTSKCVDLRGDTTNGNPLQIWDCA